MTQTLLEAYRKIRAKQSRCANCGTEMRPYTYNPEEDENSPRCDACGWSPNMSSGEEKRLIEVWNGTYKEENGGKE